MGSTESKGPFNRQSCFHAAKKLVSSSADIKQKDTETSLIDRFFYPKLGPGQLWEEVARKIEAKGGRVIKNARVVKVNTTEFTVKSVEIEYSKESKRETIPAEYFFSSLPVPSLMESLGSACPDNILEIARGLIFRDFITVGLLLSELKTPALPDTWIYVQEPGVSMGRIQVFNNWSPYLLKDRKNIWLGLEYFCTEGDSLWSKRS